MATILVLTSRFPYPLEKGDKLRIYHQLKALSKNNSIHLIALNHTAISVEQEDALRPFCTSMNVFVMPLYLRLLALMAALFSDKPLQVRFFYSPAIHQKIKKRIAAIQPDAIYCHLIRMSEYVRDEKNIRKTIDYMDVFSKGMQRRMDATTNPLKKSLFKFEYKRLLDYEQKIFDVFDAHTIISTQDRMEIPHPEKEQIRILPNGVEFSDFYPVDCEKKYDLLFSGNMGYPPNIESAHYAATQIIPLLQKKHPDIRLLIAGIGVTAKIKALQNKNVIVIEHWEFIRDAFAQSKIMLAPMLISIGLQNKILQAMAMKLPTIASSLANNAIHAPANEAILIADSPQAFASQIEYLLENPAIATKIAETAYHFVHANYAWGRHTPLLEKTITGSAYEK